MAKRNANTGSKGIWASLEPGRPKPEPHQVSLPIEQNEKKSRNLDFKNCRKPKRYSYKNGEEFTIGKGIVLTQEINRKLNMYKATSNNLTFNEIIDEALHEFFTSRMSTN